MIARKTRQRRARIATFCAVLALGCLVVAGCGKGGGGFKVVPVSGKVKLDGKALPEIAVTFQPVAAGTKADPGPGSTGKTDSEGKYTLMLVDVSRKAGAVVGKHEVRFAPIGPPSDPSSDIAPKIANPIPPKYQQNPPEVEVTGDKTKDGNLDFNLTSK